MRFKQHQRSQKSRYLAFALIELLVVIALQMYACDANDSFPKNDRGGAKDLVWGNADWNNSFYPSYLNQNRPGSTASGGRLQNQVLYCPSDEGHRVAEVGMSAINLIALQLPALSRLFCRPRLH